MTRESTKIKKDKMLVALQQSMGVVSSACTKAGVSRSQHYVWMEEDKEYKEAVYNVSEMAIDLAEASLLNQIREGNTSATIFYLKTKGKNRGYVERTELSMPDNTPIKVHIIDNGSQN
jgi:adenosylcobinamide amidohydrolase